MADFICQSTLAEPVGLTGIGLHTGCQIQVRLVPSDQVGLTFVRTDLPGEPEVHADFERVVGTTHATVLQAGEAEVSTPEHLLAALWACGITCCRIELSGAEVPILDGSALPWVELVQRAGKRDLPMLRPTLSIRNPVWVQSPEGGSVLALPHSAFRLTAAVDYGVPQAGAQTVDLVVSAANFARELAPARTFTLESWIGPLQAAGLIRGGSPENATIIGPEGPSAPWRLPNELARHKALDAIGDFALLLAPTGALFQAHLIVVRAGHGLHFDAMRATVDQDALNRF